MSDLASMIQNEFIGAWNARDAQRVAAQFAPDAVVNLVPAFPGLPGTFKGKDEVGMFVSAFIQGIHVDGRNYHAAGNTVTFDARVVADGLRPYGLASVTQHDEVTVEDGKVKSFTITLTPESKAELEANTAKGL